MGVIGSVSSMWGARWGVHLGGSTLKVVSVDTSVVSTLKYLMRGFLSCVNVYEGGLYCEITSVLIIVAS